MWVLAPRCPMATEAGAEAFCLHVVWMGASSAWKLHATLATWTAPRWSAYTVEQKISTRTAENRTRTEELGALADPAARSDPHGATRRASESQPLGFRV